MHVDSTPVGNVGSGNDDLITYSLPAGTLANDGDTLRCIFSGTFAANANTKTGTIYFGASNSLVISNSSAGVLYWLAEMIVTRLSATTQLIHIRGNSNAGALYNQWISGAETLANAITIKVVGSATSNDDIVQKGLTVEYLPLNNTPPPGVTTTLANRTFAAYTDGNIGTYPLEHAYFNKIVRRWEGTTALMGGANLTGAAATVSSSVAGYEGGLHSHVYIQTATSVNAAASIRNVTAEWDMADYGAGWFMVFRCNANSTYPGAYQFKGDSRVFLGMQQSTSAMAGGTDPSGLTNIVGFGKDTADTNIQFMHNDASGTATKVDTGLAPTAMVSDALYDFSMWLIPSSASVGWSIHRVSTRALIASGVASTNLPAGGALYTFHGFIGNGSAGSGSRLDFNHIHIEAAY
jgi:hypothetical protein